MGDEWQYQLRLYLNDTLSDEVRSDPDNPAIRPLTETLRGHNAEMKCQYDAFAGYVSEAESRGVENYPLYEWTKATIENAEKKAKYLKSFTLYIEGDEVYAKEKADALEADLQAHIDGKSIVRMSKHDTNPANNPQPPKQYRK